MLRMVVNNRMINFQGCIEHACMLQTKPEQTTHLFKHVVIRLIFVTDVDIPRPRTSKYSINGHCVLNL